MRIREEKERRVMRRVWQLVEKAERMALCGVPGYVSIKFLFFFF